MLVVECLVLTWSRTQFCVRIRRRVYVRCLAMVEHDLASLSFRVVCNFILVANAYCREAVNTEVGCSSFKFAWICTLRSVFMHENGWGAVPKVTTTTIFGFCLFLEITVKLGRVKVKVSRWRTFGDFWCRLFCFTDQDPVLKTSSVELRLKNFLRKIYENYKFSKVLREKLRKT